LKTRVLLDTGIWAHSLASPAEIPAQLKRAIVEAQAVYVSPISLYEIAQKCRIGKWDDMLPHVESLPSVAREQGVLWATLTPEVLLEAARMSWSHRDPFDRILVATARLNGLTLVTTDRAIREYLA
jgi:PIN domain nuclease of toxin-antitoxin system